MKKMNEEQILDTNGGGYYFYCRVCGYSSDNYFDVWSHVLIKEVIPAAADIADIIGAF